MSAIILESQHKDSVINLLSSRKKFSKQENTDLVLNNLIDRTEICLDDGNIHRIIGCFENEKLVAALSQSFSSRNPLWIMNYYVTNNNYISLGKGYGLYLEKCFTKAMTDAETIGAYDFWWSVPVKYAKNGPRLQLLSPSWSRYEVYTDAVVPENKFPIFDLHKHAYGSILKPHDVFIRHAVCKQEFRSVPLTR